MQKDCCCASKMVAQEIDPTNKNGIYILRLSSALLGLAGVLSTICGFITYTYLGFYRYGGWWAGLSAVCTSIYYLVFSQSVPLNRLYISALITLVFSFVVTVIDGIGFTFLNTLKACTNNSSPPINSGPEDYYLASDTCQTKYTADCACVAEKIVENPTCYLFTAKGISGDASCDPILTTYPELVETSFSAELIMLILSVLLFVATYRCTREAEEEENLGRAAHSVQLNKL